MKRSILITALCGLSLATAQAQFYNYDVTIHEDQGPPSITELIRANQILAQRDMLDFRNRWVYQLVNIQRAFWIRAVPGLGAAIAHNNWGAAYSFFGSWIEAEMAYEKKYRQFSPAWQAAHYATWGRKSTAQDLEIRLKQAK